MYDRMDNSIKVTAIMFFVTGTIASLLISVYILHSFKNKDNKPVKQVTEQAVETPEEEVQLQPEKPVPTDRFRQYGATVFTGYEVLALVEKFKDEDIAISVSTNPLPIDEIKGYGPDAIGNIWFIKNDLYGTKFTEDEENLQITQARDINNKSYINTSDEYYSVLNFQVEAIIGISFFKVAL